MCKYYGYIRVSTETQLEKGYGLEAQRIEIEKYAAANNISLTAIYEDAGISGNIADDADDDEIAKRVGLLELLSAVDPHDTVIVLNTSRLWRSEMTKAIVRRELIKHDVKLISIEQPRYDLNSKDPNNYLINAIMEALDIYERMSISLKLARGRSVKAKGGDKPAGLCPYGYQYSDDKKSVTVNKTEAATVKRVFSEAQKGSSLQQIADGLNSDGVPTRRGKEWTRGTLSAMLHNRFYLGELTHQGKTIQGNHTPLVSKIQFGKAAAQLNRRHK